MYRSEKFAVSLVSLALVRNGYSTHKDAPGGSHLKADILAVRQCGQALKEQFVVQVKALPDRCAIPAPLYTLREQYQSQLEHTVYFAFYIDGESVLMVEPDLQQRMRFIDSEVRLELIPEALLAE